VLRKIIKTYATKSHFSVAQHFLEDKTASLFDFIGFGSKQRLPKLPRIRIESLGAMK